MTPSEQTNLDRVVQLMRIALSAPDNWKNSYISDALAVATTLPEERPKPFTLVRGNV